MGKALEIILQELNPANDLSKFSPPPHRTLSEWSELRENLIQNTKNASTYMSQIPKHIVRGGITGGTVGGILGTAFATLTGDSPIDGFITGSAYGMISGAILDFTQYSLRTIYTLIRYQRS